MSLVGQFAFGNYDRTAQTAGSGSASQPQAEHAMSEQPFERGQSLVRSLSRTMSRRQSITSPRTRSGSSRYAYADDGFGSEYEMHDMAGTKYDSDEEKDKRDREVAQLARTATRQSTWSNVPNNPFHAAQDSTLDPNSPNFKARDWIKSLVKLNEAENSRTRTAGVSFKNLNVHGFGAATDYQKDVGNIWLEAVGLVKKTLGMSHPRRIDILRDFEGLVRSGEMLVVLGPPGSGCSTLLKTLSGETHGFIVDEDSHLNYQGITANEMNKYFRGEAIYTAEVDVHFPMLSVGDTLYFAARARAPANIPGEVNKKQYASHMRDVIMATFGISHTVNTRVGNDFIRGVSGGERKRVTIAEAALSGAPLQCWDNSTRGLDSANAIEFCKTLRTGTDLLGITPLVAIYQSPQAAYDLFDKAIVLYEGRQIFFGKTTEAKAYFERMGFHCPDRQTDADFLTSMTSPQERVIKEGFENQVPRTPDEFAAAWKASPERARLLKEIDEYDRENPFGGEAYARFVESRKQQQAKRQRIKSPYTLSYGQQVRLCLWRGFRRLAGDPSLMFTQLFGNFVMALVIGSVFYNMKSNTDSFFQRGAVLFFAVLMNAFGSALEILTLYAQRPIVEKHSRYALYYPSAEAFASMLTDMPYKIMNAIVFNLALYFMVNLRREPGAFFFFLLVSFLTTLAMSMLFRTIASVSRTLSQAMTPAAIVILAIVIFTGFTIPVRYMLGWCRWINYIDVVSYAFESLIVNEFHGREFSCSSFVPVYGNLAAQQQVCSAVGSVPGKRTVSGDAYINSAFSYYHSHKWRNVGIVIAFLIFFMCIYLAATELISAKKSKGEVLVFRKGYAPAAAKSQPTDVETGPRDTGGAPLGRQQSYVEASDVILRQTAVFSWRDVCYDIKIKGEPRRILDHVDGWVKPGTLTALMGVSGAGKTTLLDTLATRVTMGVITGEMLVDGQQRDSSFQRKTGYVQQQDLHLQTSTVREALNFSALLRQPASTPEKEKLAYVDEVIKLLDMQEYAEAVVGVPGEGLNVEQRKRLTIGVELAAKPELLLFLDEPTSGLDSQTSWAICDLMEKLKKSGQAILCTIHQPSAMLFQRFDRLLFLAKGGKTVYFGEIGPNSETLTRYFERNGAHACPPDANPAEWMLEVIGAAPGSATEIDWHDTWRNSPECAEVHRHLDYLKRTRPQEAPQRQTNDKESYREFAAPLPKQMWVVTHRVFQQYWRTPSYIYSKLSLCLLSALFIGFIFYNAPLTHQGLQNQMFSIFMLFTIFGQLVQQIMPHFVTQRSLYEARERPSKTYSWKAFMFANILVELPWNTLGAILMFFCFYYPIGLYKNAVPTHSVHLRGFQFFLFVWIFLMFTSTFTDMMIAGIPDAETGGNLANLLFSLTLIFCGILQTRTALPGFWIFMNYVSPFTYLVEGLLSTGIAHQKVHCADNELLHFQPPSGMTCAEYMKPYMSKAGGYLQNESAKRDCSYCTYGDTDTFLKAVNLDYAHSWRDFGILWAYVIFNILAAIGIYWLARVPKKKKEEDEKKE